MKTEKTKQRFYKKTNRIQKLKIINQIFKNLKKMKTNKNNKQKKIYIRMKKL